jgi:hypothetical protein
VASARFLDELLDDVYLCAVVDREDGDDVESDERLRELESDSVGLDELDIYDKTAN